MVTLEWPSWTKELGPYSIDFLDCCVCPYNKTSFVTIDLSYVQRTIRITLHRRRWSNASCTRRAISSCLLGASMRRSWALPTTLELSCRHSYFTNRIDRISRLTQQPQLCKHQQTTSCSLTRCLAWWARSATTPHNRLTSCNIHTISRCFESPRWQVLCQHRDLVASTQQTRALMANTSTQVLRLEHLSTTARLLW